MVRLRPFDVSILGQLVAVRRACSATALAASKAPRRSVKAAKLESQRDALAAAAFTLSALRDSRAALDMLPDAQREQVAISLSALGYRAVRSDHTTPTPAELAHV